MNDTSHSGWRPPTIETSRLLLRALEESDVESIFAYASNPNVTRYTLWEHHKSRDGTLEFLRQGIAQYGEKVPNPVAICLKNDPQRVIGTIGCRWQNRINQCMEMGYALGEPHWGQGFTVEAARALLDFAFAGYAVERVQAHTFAENIASARVLEKIGLQYEGTLRSALYHRARFWSLKMYSVLRGEWPRSVSRDAKSSKPSA